MVYFKEQQRREYSGLHYAVQSLQFCHQWDLGDIIDSILGENQCMCGRQTVLEGGSHYMSYKFPLSTAFYCRQIYSSLY